MLYKELELLSTIQTLLVIINIDFRLYKYQILGNLYIKKNYCFFLAKKD